MTEIDNDKLLRDFFVFIGMINHGTSSLDPKSIIIAAVVLLFMATRKVASMA